MTEHTQANEATAPLKSFANLRVVELGLWMAAPSATALLADLGAQVVKIEPKKGDPSRGYGANSNEEVLSTFALDNRRKRSLCLDLNDPDDHARLLALVEQADVFVTNVRLPTLRRARLMPSDLLPQHSRLVYGSITAFGASGPDQDAPGYDVGAFWARTGLSYQITPDGNPPTLPTSGYGDRITGLVLCSAILAALHERQVTGRGGLVETSLLRAGGWVVGPDLGVHASLGRSRPSAQRHDTSTPLINSYCTSDGRWICLMGVEAERHLSSILRAVGLDNLIGDERFATLKAIRTNRRDLIALLDDAFCRETLDTWRQRLDAAGVWWQLVQRPDEVLQDAQLLQNDLLEDVQISRDRTIPMIVSPFRVLGHREPGPARAPALTSDDITWE
jgi:crotonobetainyl-CoA:carnitine CoA-transferase CaiB-like acyl-CoA transferase